MKKEILLWMAGLVFIFSLLLLPSISAYPYQFNFCNMSINNSLQNYTGNISLLCSQGFSFIDFPSLSFNFTNSSNATYAIQLGIVLFNNTLYLIPSTNLTYDNFGYGYNRTEMDNFFMSKADWANFNSITLKEYLTRQEYLNNTNNSQWLEQVNATSQLRTDIDSQKSSMDTWKLIIITTLIISIINLLWMIKVAFFS